MGTTGTRVITGIISLSIVAVNARLFGASGMGEIALFLLGIHLTLLFCEWLAGSALVYLSSRHGKATIMFIASLWIFLITALLYALVKYTDVKFFTHNVLIYLCMIVLVQGINQTFMHLLVGDGKLRLYNTLSMLGPAIVLVLLLSNHFARLSTEPVYYYKSLLAAQCMVFTVGSIGFLRLKPIFSPLRPALQQMAGIGFFVQFANVVQFLNYRLVFLLIEKYLGLASLGIYNVGNQISEAVWLPGRSAALVHYSEASGMSDSERQIAMALRMLRYTAITTGVLLLGVFLVPEFVFRWVFGEAFGESKRVFVYLLPGIFLFSLSFPVSSYFAGLGLQRYNAGVSAAGLALLMLLGWSIIPHSDVVGVCRVVSIVYGLQSILALLLFKRHSGLQWLDLLAGERRN
jgi:O-antigen/teichoic acid export membrane protein